MEKRLKTTKKIYLYANTGISLGCYLHENKNLSIKKWKLGFAGNCWIILNFDKPIALSLIVRFRKNLFVQKDEIKPAVVMHLSSVGLGLLYTLGDTH